MIKFFLILIIFLFPFIAESQNSAVLVEEFVQANNNRDKDKVHELLHEDFQQLYDKQVTIESKKDYMNHYEWGIVMNDLLKIEIIAQQENKIVAKAKYFSDRDRLLKLGPYKSINVYVLKNNQIISIIDKGLQTDTSKEQSRLKAYELFREWMKEKYNLSFSDFTFDQEGANKLKKVLTEYVEKTVSR
ncbi:MAG: hypothetical protein R3E90_12750 [Marinicella sp.]